MTPREAMGHVDAMVDTLSAKAFISPGDVKNLVSELQRALLALVLETEELRALINERMDDAAFD